MVDTVGLQRLLEALRALGMTHRLPAHTDDPLKVGDFDYGADGDLRVTGRKSNPRPRREGVDLRTRRMPL